MDVKSICQGCQPAVDLNNHENSSDISDKVKNVDKGNLNQSGTQSNYTPRQKQISEKEVKDAADKLNKLFEGKATHVEYEFVGKSKQISIKIINNDTKEVLKEIPPKKIVEMIDKLCELAGIMVDEKA